MVGSLPRGMPKVVDYRQTGAQATNEMVTQDRHEIWLDIACYCLNKTMEFTCSATFLAVLYFALAREHISLV